MGTFLPVTSKLWPGPKNLMYLAEVAVLTRLATGLTRVLENRPDKQKNPAISEGQKRQAMTERFFVEILGTMGYMACLHLGQDLVDAVANLKKRTLELPAENLLKSMVERPEFADVKTLLDKLNIKVDDLDQKLKASVQETYGSSQFKNPVFSTLYEHKLPGSLTAETVVGKANLATVKEQLKKKVESAIATGGHALEHPQQLDAALSKIVNEVKPLKAFAMQNNKLAIAGILTGVIGSALVGGSLTQWLNDRVVAPGAKKFFSGKNPKKTLPVSASMSASGPIPGAPSGTSVSHAMAHQKSFSVLSSPAALPASPIQPPAAMMPVYLPNPKMRATGPMFSAQPVPPYPVSGAFGSWPGASL